MTVVEHGWVRVEREVRPAADHGLKVESFVALIELKNCRTARLDTCL
jgi:hypothetical protein